MKFNTKILLKSFEEIVLEKKPDAKIWSNLFHKEKLCNKLTSGAIAWFATGNSIIFTENDLQKGSHILMQNLIKRNHDSPSIC